LSKRIFLKAMKKKVVVKDFEFGEINIAYIDDKKFKEKRRKEFSNRVKKICKLRGY